MQTPIIVSPAAAEASVLLKLDRWKRSKAERIARVKGRCINGYYALPRYVGAVVRTLFQLPLPKEYVRAVARTLSSCLYPKSA